MKQTAPKAFSTLSAVMLGIGSMVGAGVFIVIGQAGAITGNLVWLSFIFGGLIALLSGYSLAKLALRYPSRGGIPEYLVQSFGDGMVAGVFSILFYFSQLVTIAAVAKSFGIYLAVLLGQKGAIYAQAYSMMVILLFMAVHLIGSSMVAKFENIIVGVKITILVVFVAASLFYIDPTRLSLPSTLHIDPVLFAVGLTFFAYQGFSVITNTIEDMQNPKKTMLKAMHIAILSVMVLYVSISLVVFGSLSLDTIIKAQDYALAKAAEPFFGALGFKIIAITALLATASAINATLFAATEIGYTMAKKGELPTLYEHHVFHTYEGLIVSSILILPVMLFFDLSHITTVAALIVLVVQGITHAGHLLKIKETGAKRGWIALAMVSMFGIAVLMIYYNVSKSMEILYSLAATMVIAIGLELVLRYVAKRKLLTQS